MLKYLLLAVALIWLFYSPAVRGLRKPGKPGAPKGPPPHSGQTEQPGQPVQAPQVEAMLRCAHCGVHLPQSEALLNDQGQPFCSAAHRQAGWAAR
jgi:uncharacterized protein